MKLVLVNAFVGSSLFAYTAIVFLFPGTAFFAHRCQFRPRGLLINSSVCHVPDIDPMDSCTKPFVNQDVSPTVCSTRPPLTYIVRRDGNLELHVAAHVASRYGVYSMRHLQCCYSVITRETETTNRIGECSVFEGSVTLPHDVEHLLVRCVNLREKRHVYVHLHAVVQSPAVRKDLIQPLTKPRKRRMNVVVLGIDSMSRLGFERSMPRTASHLRETGWHELRGYTKVAMNTLPNMMAILTGLDERQLTDISCLYPGENITYDHCPFLWNKFKAAGYVTAYAEESYTNNFLWVSSGFQHRPTDYYLRPLVVTSSAWMKRVSKYDFCYGEVRSVDLLLNQLVNLAETYKEGLFGLFWFSTFTHDFENLPGSEDVTMLDFLRRLGDTGALDSTMFVFLSDHGNRFGDTRFTEAGWYEYRMPFIYVHLPEWFAAAHPDAVKNLASNRDHLTTPFDLHQTLRDVLRLADDDPKELLGGCPGCPQCDSLFAPVKVERSCTDAGVPDTWCPCWPLGENVATWSHEPKMVAEAVVHHLNQKLRKVDDRLGQPGRCAKLRVDFVASARRIERKSSTFDEYEVVFLAGPGQLVYEVTARHWLHETPPRFETTDGGGRMLYVDDLACDFVPNIADMRLLCYCQTDYST